MTLPRPSLSFVVACALLISIGAASRAADADVPGPLPGAVRRYALIIGNNAPPRAGLARLRYADDDAVRWSVLFAALGASVEVLTELDDESRRLYDGLTPAPQPPSRAALRLAVDRIGAQIAAARAQGASTVLYFVYAGHGDVAEGEGYLTLTDGRFSRADLASLVLTPAGAHVNHVIVDACRASYFVGSRGPGGTRRRWQDAYVESGAAPLPNTGFLLSTSSSGLTHEWEEFQAGIFSHEVRSGLFGPADANGDGLITYGELAGFVRLANRPVLNERFRPQIIARAPTGGDAVVLDLHAARAGSLALEPSESPGHQLLEDRTGVRWVDFHPGATSRVHLILASPSWSPPGFYLRSTTSDTEYVIPSGRDSRLADLSPQPARLVHRGALDDAFMHLFDLPFDQTALEIVRLETDRPIDVAAEPPGADLPSRPPHRLVGIGLTATGGASLAAAIVLAVSASHLRDTADQADGQHRVGINSDIADRNRWTAITGVGGGLLAAAGLALLLWPRPAPAQDQP